MSFSVVILSNTASNVVPCIAAVREHEPQLHPKDIIVVDDGIELTPAWAAVAETVTVVCGEKPFVFSRNANIGFRAALRNDVILLNDDALLRTPGGFSKLAEVAAGNPEYGVVAAVSNSVGNLNQTPDYTPPGKVRIDPRQVCFICVYIPRAVYDLVGPLDERYVDYGMDDDDYCLRVRMEGLKLAICGDCFLNHNELPSAYRGRGCGNFLPNLKRFKEKWGCDNFGRPA